MLITSFVTFTYWFCIALGITKVITDSYLFSLIKMRLRTKHTTTHGIVYSDNTLTKFLGCDICVGFWVALLFSFVISPTSILEVSKYLEYVLNGFLFVGLLIFFKYVIERGEIRQDR